MPTRQQSRPSEHDCYAILGLQPGASRDDVEAAYTDWQRVIDRARQTPDLRGWAERQGDLTEQAYAALTAPRPVSGRRAFLRHGQPTAQPPVRRRWRHRRRLSQADAGWSRRLARGWRELPERSRALILALGSGLLTLVIILIVQQVWFGRPMWFGQPVTSSQSSAVEAKTAAPTEPFVPLDQGRVAELQARVERDATDAEALFELGERHFQAGKWQETIDWFTRLLAIDPGQVHARTDIGTAQFNLGRFAEARAAWTEALALAPNDVQLHYNLGFLYANGQPRDVAAARREWEATIKLAPGSELAVQAQRDLDALQQRQNQPLAPRSSP